jgi:hypothetical protein
MQAAFCLGPPSFSFRKQFCPLPVARYVHAVQFVSSPVLEVH